MEIRAAFSSLTTFLLLLAIPLTAAGQQTQDQSGYVAEILKERQNRVSRLRHGDFSPLKKVGSHRLEDSARVTIGSSPDADVRLDAEGIALVHAVVEGSSLTPMLRAQGGPVFSTWDNSERVELTLKHETGFRIGRFNLHYWINPTSGARTLQVFDPQTPALREFAGLEYFPVDPAYRITAEVVPSQEPQQVKLLDSRGNEQSWWIFGELRFSVQGISCQLELYTLTLDPAAIQKEGFMLMFTDDTSGKESYPATRYLTVEGKMAGTITVDFNRASTPPCNFSPLYSCPFPRPQNRLLVPIRAGEKWYRKKPTGA